MVDSVDSGLVKVQSRIREIRNRFWKTDQRSERVFIDVLDEAGKKAESSRSEDTVDREILKSGLNSIIREKSRCYGVDENLVKSVVQMESGGNPHATSSAGAMGLMQLMPSTADMLGVDDPYDPEQNIDGGVRYLKMLLERYEGKEDLSLAAYHSGPSRVDKYGGIPPYPAVTRYVKSVMSMTDRAKGE